MSQRRRKPRPSLTRRGKVLFNFQMTRWRQKAWAEKPEVMEAIRQRAINKAKAVKDEKRQRLKGYIGELPDKVTTDELMTLIGDEYCQQREVKRTSFLQHLKRHGLMSYDASTGYWINNCK